MKKMYLVVFTIFAFSSAFAKKPAFQLTFGSGGGFTGLTINYTVKSDRTFYKEENLSHKQEQLHKVKCKDVRQIRKLLKTVNFSILNIHKSGNISTYLVLVQNGKEYKTEWTGSESGNPALDALYKKLYSLIPKK